VVNSFIDATAVRCVGSFISWALLAPATLNSSSLHTPLQAVHAQVRTLKITHTHIHIIYTRTYAHTHTQTHIHTHTQNAHTHKHTCVHKMHTHKHTCVHTHTHAYTHTHTHTHTHTRADDHLSLMSNLFNEARATAERLVITQIGGSVSMVCGNGVNNVECCACSRFTKRDVRSVLI